MAEDQQPAAATQTQSDGDGDGDGEEMEMEALDVSAAASTESPAKSADAATADTITTAAAKTKDEDDVEDTGAMDQDDKGNNENEEDGENESSAASSAGEDQPKLLLGGKIPSTTPAYALLTGLYQDPKAPETKTTVSVPITRIPATLGRTHKTDSQSFFGLGTAKALSRSHASIYYRDGNGGTLQYSADNDGLAYHPREEDKKKMGEGEYNENSDIKMPANSTAGSNNTGFFVLECLGKNKINVGGQKIEQGQAALLTHGTTIRMASYSLYFLLPEDASSTTMKVPNPKYATYQRKRAREEAKIKLEQQASKKGKTAQSPARANKKNDGGGGGGTGKTGQGKVISDLDALPTSQLLRRFREACEGENAWGRAHQLLNSTIAIHAVRAAARSETMRDVAAELGGVQRGEVLTWIKDSNIFKAWVEGMLGKIEQSSFEKNITVAIQRAGYTKAAGSTGRQTRWVLPAVQESQEEEDDEGSEEEDVSSSNDDDDEDSNVESSDDRRDKEEEKEEKEGEDETSAAADGDDERRSNDVEAAGGSREEEEEEETGAAGPMDISV